MPIPKRDPNPYVDAFWKWWPDLYRDLHTFRITGGEPLMSKDTWRVLDYIIQEPEPNKNLNLAINSSLFFTRSHIIPLPISGIGWHVRNSLLFCKIKTDVPKTAFSIVSPELLEII